MKFKNLIKTGLTAILASSLALASPNLPREYKGAKFGYTLDEVKEIYPNGELYQDWRGCEDEEAGIGVNNIQYHNYGEINGLTIDFCFPKNSNSKLSRIILKYNLPGEDILNLIEESKRRYGPPMKEEIGEEYPAFCSGESEDISAHKSQQIRIFWVDNNTRLIYSGWLNSYGSSKSKCYNSSLGIYITDRNPSAYNKTDTLP